jgi:eukaryotic-like serine/threonine-protein kinase
MSSIDPPLIGPVAGSTPARPGGRRARRRPLPADLLRDASRRLGVVSLVAGALWAVATALWHVAFHALSHDEVRWLGLGVPDLIAAVCVLASVLLYFYTRRSDGDPRRILDLGLGYMVLMAVALGMVFHWSPMEMNGPIKPEISWIGALVLIFAAIVPSTPGKTLAAAFVSVSMNPVSMLIARDRGSWPFEAATDALLMHYPDYLLVGVAVVISLVVTSLGQQVARAREMGSYRLGELLGRGGMGEVYKATHRMLARPAAIKLIRRETLGAGNTASAQLAVARFHREAMAAANLRSPHTVELYDFGVAEDQTLYFVMELLEGMDLESLVGRHGPVPAGRVVHILRQVCESLDEAHVSGLVHRDIKPANIHVGRLGLVDDFVKVLDFGLVKPADGRVADSTATQAGLILGTPGYMAPEMALGDSVDGRADLYAVGCVAYYLLTGEQVFKGATPTQVMAQHLQVAPVPPSERTTLAITPAMDRLVLDCLAKKPEDRPQSAADLARRLAALDVEPWTESQAREWWALARTVVGPLAAATEAIDTGAVTRAVSSAETNG